MKKHREIPEEFRGLTSGDDGSSAEEQKDQLLGIV